MTSYAVVDKQGLADTIRKVLDAGLALLKKDKFESTDFAKMKVMKSMGTGINASVAMVQQETARDRIELIRMRMKQLGYETPKGIESSE